MFDKLKDKYRTWKRDEVRIAPYGVRGRVYAKKHPEVEASATAEKRVVSSGKAELTMKIKRADGSVEVRKEPASVEVIN